MILLFLPITSGCYTQNYAKEYHLLRISFSWVCSWSQLVYFWPKRYLLSFTIMYYTNKKEINNNNNSNNSKNNNNNNNPSYYNKFLTGSIV